MSFLITRPRKSKKRGSTTVSEAAPVEEDECNMLDPKLWNKSRPKKYVNMCFYMTVIYNMTKDLCKRFSTNVGLDFRECTNNNNFPVQSAAVFSIKVTVLLLTAAIS